MNEVNIIFCYLIGILYNIASVVCFTILAIIFNKWWIVFFSLLFIRDISIKTTDEKESNEE